MALEEAGVALIAQGANAYIGDMKAATNATDTFVDATDKGGGRVSSASQVMIGALRHVGTMAVDAFAQAAKATAAFVGDSISLAGDFDQKMSVLQATSGATAEEMEQLSAKAKELGSDLSLPATSAVDAGEAMLELAKAGFTVQEQMDAAKGVLQLAAAAQIDEAKAAEINANALQAFGLEANKSMFVSDLLAASANASSINATDMADTYKMAAAVFSAFQGPVVGSEQALIDLTTAASLLGNAGIKGSDAGTALKQSLLQLSGPSMKAKEQMRALYLAITAEGDAGQNLSLVLQGNAADRAAGLRGLQESAGATAEMGDIAYDAAGKMRTLPEILRLTAAATKNMTQEQRDGAITSIFGADAMRAILILMQQGPDAWDKMTGAVTRQGSAQDLAAAQTQGFNGALEGAKSQIETLQLSIGQALTPILAELLNKYISPGIASITAFADSFLKMVPAIAASDDPLRTFLNALKVAAPGLYDVISAVEGVRDTLSRVIGFFNQAGGAADNLSGVIENLSSIWDKALTVVTNVGNGYLSIAKAILPIVGKFWEDHGTEITAFLKMAYDKIMNIVNLALDLYNAIVPKTLGSVAQWIEDHATGIQSVLSGAWQAISGIIEGALTLIEGTFKIALDIINGDWEKAWTDLQAMSVSFVGSLGKVIEGFLNIIAGFFNTSLQEIVDLWQHNWDMLVKIATQTDWLQVGQDVVDGILSGLRGSWDSLTSWLTDAASDLVNAALDAIGAHSPATEFMPVGEYSVLGIMQGFSDTWPQLTNLVGTLSDKLIDQMQDIGRQMQDVTADAFGATASIDRQVAANLEKVGNVGDDFREQFLSYQLRDQQKIAEAFADPATGAAYFKMASANIFELEELRNKLNAAQDEDERARIQQQIKLIESAQGAEMAAFNARQPTTNPMTDIADQINAIMQSLAGINLTDDQIKIVDMLSGVFAGLQAPITSQQGLAPPQTSYPATSSTSSTSSTTNVNMPIYTNNSPAALQQSWAIMQASMA